MQTFSGIAADREKSDTAGTNADGDTLQQRAKVVSFGRPCWLEPTREARVNAGNTTPSCLVLMDLQS